MKKLIASLLLIVFIFSGCNLFKKDPQAAVTKGFQKLAEVKKLSSSLKIKGTIASPAGEKPSKMEILLDISGKSELSNNEFPTADLSIKVETTIDEQKVDGEIMLKTDNDKAYFNLASLNVSGDQGKILKDQLASFFNKWWFIALEEGGLLPKIDKKKNKEFVEKLKNSNLFVNARDTVEEVVSDMNMTRYRVDLDKEALKNFIVEAGRLGGNTISAEEENALREGLNNLEFSGLVWVGSDNAIHKIQGTLSATPVQGPSSSYDIEFLGWNYGEDIEVIVPEGSSEFNPLLLLPLIAALSGGSAPAPVAQPPVVTTPPPAKTTPPPAPAASGAN